MWLRPISDRSVASRESTCNVALELLALTLCQHTVQAWVLSVPGSVTFFGERKPWNPQMIASSGCCNVFEVSTMAGLGSLSTVLLAVAGCCSCDCSLV